MSSFDLSFEDVKFSEEKITEIRHVFDHYHRQFEEENLYGKKKQPEEKRGKSGKTSARLSQHGNNGRNGRNSISNGEGRNSISNGEGRNSISNGDGRNSISNGDGRNSMNGNGRNCTTEPSLSNRDSMTVVMTDNADDTLNVDPLYLNAFTGKKKTNAELSRLDRMIPKREFLNGLRALGYNPTTAHLNEAFQWCKTILDLELEKMKDENAFIDIQEYEDQKRMIDTEFQIQMKKKIRKEEDDMRRTGRASRTGSRIAVVSEATRKQLELEMQQKVRDEVAQYWIDNEKGKEYKRHIIELNYHPVNHATKNPVNNPTTNPVVDESLESEIIMIPNRPLTRIEKYLEELKFSTKESIQEKIDNTSYVKEEDFIIGVKAMHCIVIREAFLEDEKEVQALGGVDQVRKQEREENAKLINLGMKEGSTTTTRKNNSIITGSTVKDNNSTILLSSAKSTQTVKSVSIDSKMNSKDEVSKRGIPFPNPNPELYPSMNHFSIMFKHSRDFIRKNHEIQEKIPYKIEWQKPEPYNLVSLLNKNTNNYKSFHSNSNNNTNIPCNNKNSSIPGVEIERSSMLEWYLENAKLIQECKGRGKGLPTYGVNRYKWWDQPEIQKILPQKGSGKTQKGKNSISSLVRKNSNSSTNRRKSDTYNSSSGNGSGNGYSGGNDGITRNNGVIAMPDLLMAPAFSSQKSYYNGFTEDQKSSSYCAARSTTTVTGKIIRDFKSSSEQELKKSNMIQKKQVNIINDKNNIEKISSRIEQYNTATNIPIIELNLQDCTAADCGSSISFANASKEKAMEIRKEYFRCKYWLNELWNNKSFGCDPINFSINEEYNPYITLKHLDNAKKHIVNTKFHYTMMKLFDKKFLDKMENGTGQIYFGPLRKALEDFGDVGMSSSEISELKHHFNLHNNTLIDLKKFLLGLGQEV